MSQLGDYAEDYATLNFKFTTRNSQGAGAPPFALASGAISVYKGSSTTQSTAGITLAADFDGVTGLNNVLIDLSSDVFYATGQDYHVVITTGTVNSISVVGEVVAEFSIENRFKDVNVTAISGDSSAADNLESACDNYSVTRGLTGTALPAAVADAAGGVAISTAGSLDIDATDANVTLTLEDTAVIGALGAGLTDITGRLPSVLTKGTADSGTTTTMVDAVLTEGDTDYWAGNLIRFTSGNISGQTRFITGFTTASDTITFFPATTQAVSTNTYEILPMGNGDWANGGRLDLLLDAILVDTGTQLPTTLGARSDAAETGDPGATKNVIEYLKQIVNLMIGSDGAATMPSSQAPANAINLFEMVRAIYDDTNSLDGTKIPNTISLANINAEMDTALRTTTDGEPAQGTPGATISLEEKISWLYKAWRNRTPATATQYNLHNDDTSTIDTKATLADDATTASRTEMVSGP